LRLLEGLSPLIAEDRLIERVPGQVPVEGDLADRGVGAEEVEQLRFGVILGHPVTAEAFRLRQVGVKVRDQVQTEPDRFRDGAVIGIGGEDVGSAVLVADQRKADVVLVGVVSDLVRQRPIQFLALQGDGHLSIAPIPDRQPGVAALARTHGEPSVRAPHPHDCPFSIMNYGGTERKGHG
jgi:hypothetical protein